MVQNVDKITKQEWLEATFPEWGTWLNEEIANYEVPKDNFSMWWLANMGIWLKSDQGTNVTVDMYCTTGKRTIGDGKMAIGHQMMRMSGGRELQPNRRNQPFVIDPFEVKDIDVFLVTHTHSDHLCFYSAAGTYRNCPDALFVGPQAVVDTWIEWGIPKERTHVLTVNETIEVKDVKITGLESFDRTALITEPDPNVKLAGTKVKDMDLIALNYLIETSGGSVYHGGDSHYSNLYAKHGKEHDIDVHLGAFGENPIGITDKLTSADFLKAAEALQVDVTIPIHHDIWTNFYADPREITLLWEFKKARMGYKFHPFIWQVGGQYTYPQDRELTEYMYYRGFSDIFENDYDTPFPSFL